MRVILKISIFAVVFSGLFYFVRTNDFYNTKIFVADLGGTPWLYSAIGLIFSIIAAFAIQKEWDNWNNLTEAAGNEIDSLEELWLWAEHLGNNIGKRTKELIMEYLGMIVNEGLRKGERGERSEAAENILLAIRRIVLAATAHDSHFLSLFGDVLKHRRDRLRFSARHMPDILRYTLIFSLSLLIFLSFFIGVKNVWLDYIFTVSIATLVYAVYTVIADLDYPLQPGGWHFTTRDYEDLLRRIK